MSVLLVWTGSGPYAIVLGLVLGLSKQEGCLPMCVDGELESGWAGVSMRVCFLSLFVCVWEGRV